MLMTREDARRSLLGYADVLADDLVTGRESLRMISRGINLPSTNCSEDLWPFVRMQAADVPLVALRPDVEAHTWKVYLIDIISATCPRKEVDGRVLLCPEIPFEELARQTLVGAIEFSRPILRPFAQGPCIMVSLSGLSRDEKTELKGRVLVERAQYLQKLEENVTALAKWLEGQDASAILTEGGARINRAGHRILEWIERSVATDAL